MKIAIAGYSGFIGSHLTKYLTNKGHTVLSLGRNHFFKGSEEILSHVLSQADAVINLAGAPINRRWSESYKRKMYESRVTVTRKIVDSINNSEHKPELFISASAVGYYPSSGCYDEYFSVKGDNFLAELCDEWEGEARKISSTVRSVITRFGVVLASKGGAFEKMALPAKAGVSVVFGSGKQHFSWIDMTDLLRAIEHIMSTESVDGVVNFVAPGVTSNEYLTKKTAEHYRSLFTLKIPSSVICFLFGESSTVLLDGQCINSLKLQESGFVFSVPSIDVFFDNLSDNS
jgi:uncharacterized protein (TIGR01777 family)